MPEKIAFLDMFACCGDISELCGGLERAYVREVTVSREKMSMTIEADFARVPAPAELSVIEGRIAAHFGLSGAKITTQSPVPAAPTGQKAEKKKTGKVLYGKNIKGEPVPMSELNLESGSVIVRGEVFEVDSREIQKRKVWVLSF